MNKKIFGISALVAALVIGAGTYYFTTNQNTNKDSLTLGINTGELPFYEFAKKELKKEGVELKITSFDDYIQPNLAVASGTLDINAFQHIPYLNKFKQEHKENANVQQLVPLTKTLASPLRLYSNKYKNLDEFLKQKVLKIAVPNDATNEARALHLLESKGLIKLKKADLTATIKDVVKTNYNIDIKELDAAQTPKVLNEVDGSVINGNYAQVNNVTLDKALIVESENVYHTFDNIVAGKSEIKNKPAYKKFADFIKSKKAIEKRKELNKYDIFITEK